MVGIISVVRLGIFCSLFLYRLADVLARLHDGDVCGSGCLWRWWSVRVFVRGKGECELEGKGLFCMAWSAFAECLTVL